MIRIQYPLLSLAFRLGLLASSFLVCDLWRVQTVAGDGLPNVIVIYTDDHGYADLSCQGVMADVKTPHLDALAAEGVRMTDGYCTAPQCGPSRAGLISGQYQNRFGMEANGFFDNSDVLDEFYSLNSLPKRLKRAGYATGMAGKSHLGSNECHKLNELGFDKVFFKHSNASGQWNMDLQGQDLVPQPQQGGGYHLDLISDFACSFIERFQTQPFFFYLAYRAPHVPLDAPNKYLQRFPGQMPERRRQALAMLSAIDDGVGRMMDTLDRCGIEKDTLIFVASDNGAPLKIHKIDAPGGGPGWDGSLNDPLNGEKGMLTEGGIRIPFLVRWKGTIPGGQTYSHPVTTLDIAATASALAQCTDHDGLDGVNLVPFLTGMQDGPPHQALYWRWFGQSAIRMGEWKYLRCDDREYLFDLAADTEETQNLINVHPPVAEHLQSELMKWAGELSPPGLAAVKSENLSRAGHAYFDWYLDGKRVDAVAPAPRRSSPRSDSRRQSTPISDAELFAKRDVDRSGEVTWQEFLAGRTGDTVPALKKLFAKRDQNQDGIWQQNEIKSLAAGARNR